MPRKFLIAAVAAVVVLAAVQFHLAHQLSNMESQTRSTVTDEIKRTKASVLDLSNKLDVMSDQLNTVGRDNFDPQRLRRDLLRQMRQMGNAPLALIIGDSITQRAPLPDTVCGVPIINAGISGSRTSDFIPFAELMVAQGIKPAAVVVSLGVNDAQSRFKTAKSFSAAYRLLLDNLPDTKIELATLAPVDFSGSDGKNIAPAKLETVDTAIRTIAANRKFNIIDLGTLDDNAPFPTIDGLHPTVDAYKGWIAAVLNGIKTALSDHCGAQRGVSRDVQRPAG